jgi:xylobiose transport system substrate-binding protein
VAAAPSFQLSWDQAYPPAASTPMHQAVQQFFNGQLDADGFIKAMQALPTE